MLCLRSLLILSTLLIGPAYAETLVGVVVGVTDGDTITVLDSERQEHKVRLGGIDAPEKAQPFGQRSKENLSRLVFKKEVAVEWEKRDKYRRIVGKVMVQPSDCPTCPKTLDAGQAQLSVGMAWWYRKFDRIVLAYFVACGVSRLARYNVTAQALSEGGDKVKYFEGTPIPTSLLIVGIMFLATTMGAVGSTIWFGEFTLAGFRFHPLVLMFALSGSLMISRIRIPKV